jgi:hypothetical protein
MDNQPGKRGPKPNKRRAYYMKEYGLKPDHSGAARNTLRESFLDQLDACQSDEARRLLIGKSIKFTELEDR